MTLDVLDDLPLSDDEDLPPHLPVIVVTSDADDWNDPDFDVSPEPPAPAPAKPKVEPTHEPPPPPVAHTKAQRREAEAAVAASVNQQLRSPICVIMGHVDTGKTKLLDKIRHTNVQAGEAGGITQQIGATYFPVSMLQKMTQFFAEKWKLEYKLPGLLIIDTPGHASFSNLRSRGSSLCDIAILVVDIMHGIEQQTKESIGMLKSRKSLFIIALNKIDRLVDWKPCPNQPFLKSIETQSKATKEHFTTLLQKVQTEFQQEGLNTMPYFRMKLGEEARISEFPIVPTSAITGEGIPDLLMLAQWLTQTRMKIRLASKDELQCTVLEVKVEEGIGVTLDVILVNGVLHVNDMIIVAGIQGPIVTKVRALLTPEPLKELRVRSQWVHHEVIYAAMGCKISAPDLDGAIAGSELFVATTDDEIAEARGKVNADVTSIFDIIERSANGVLVHASTLGSLEALLTHLKDPAHVPVSQVGIGPLHRKDVLAFAPMAERAPKCAVILAFDVPITPEAATAARDLKIKIFSAPIIYHLTQEYDNYLKRMEQEETARVRASVVWPVRLRVLGIFKRSKPIIIGVKVVEGMLRKGTPLVVVADKPFPLGKVDTIKKDNKDVTDPVGPGSEVSIAITSPEGNVVGGKDFKPDSEFISKMTRQDIELLKQYFRSEVKKEEWRLIIEIKQLLGIPGP